MGINNLSSKGVDSYAICFIRYVDFIVYNLNVFLFCKYILNFCWICYNMGINNLSSKGVDSYAICFGKS